MASSVLGMVCTTPQCAQWPKAPVVVARRGLERLELAIDIEDSLVARRLPPVVNRSGRRIIIYNILPI